MAGNSNFNKAARAKKDEFYTQLSDIEKELRHYRKHFKGKKPFSIIGGERIPGKRETELRVVHMKAESKRNAKRAARGGSALRLAGAALAAALVAAGAVCAAPGEAQAYEAGNAKCINCFTGEVTYEPVNCTVNWTYPNFKRLAGNTAMGTMRKVALEGWKDTGSEWAVVCRNDGWHDALSASGVAGLLDAPVLTTKTTELSDATRKTLKELKVKKVVVAGGEQAVSKATEKQIAALGVDVERVAGATASGTAVKMWRFGLAHGGWSETCAVATANTYQDALSIAPYAYARHVPVLIAQEGGKGSGRTLTEAARKAASGFSRTLVLGGTSAVASPVERAVPGAKRLAGGTAYGTSAAVASFCLAEGMSAAHAGAATGSGYHDALSGAALCGKKGSVLVLADEGHAGAVKKVLAPRKAELSEKWCYIFGGTEAFDSKALNPLVDWNEQRAISPAGESVYAELCPSCGLIANSQVNFEHQQLALYEWTQEYCDGKHTVEEAKAASVCMSWCNLYYEVRGGTRTFMMSNGERFSTSYDMNGTIVRQL